MNRAASFMLSICFVGILSAQTDKLAVLDLDARGISVAEAGSLTDRLRSELVKTGLVTIVERGAMEAILLEQDFQMSGCTSDECAVEVGQLLGVTQMLAGSIGKVGTTYSVDLRLVDVETGQIVRSLTHDYRGLIDDMLSQMAEIAQELVNAPSLESTLRGESSTTPQQTAVAKKRSPVLKWIGLTAVVAGGGYLALTLLEDEPTPNSVGLPPMLPEGPQ